MFGIFSHKPLDVSNLIPFTSATSFRMQWNTVPRLRCGPMIKREKRSKNYSTIVSKFYVMGMLITSSKSLDVSAKMQKIGETFGVCLMVVFVWSNACLLLFLVLLFHPFALSNTAGWTMNCLTARAIFPNWPSLQIMIAFTGRAIIATTVPLAIPNEKQWQHGLWF